MGVSSRSQQRGNGQTRRMSLQMFPDALRAQIWTKTGRATLACIAPSDKTIPDTALFMVTVEACAAFCECVRARKSSRERAEA